MIRDDSEMAEKMLAGGEPALYAESAPLYEPDGISVEKDSGRRIFTGIFTVGGDCGAGGAVCLSFDDACKGPEGKQDRPSGAHDAWGRKAGLLRTLYHGSTDMGVLPVLYLVGAACV